MWGIGSAIRASFPIAGHSCPARFALRVVERETARTDRRKKELLPLLSARAPPRERY
jgi:hypothetical protein